MSSWRFLASAAALMYLYPGVPRRDPFFCQWVAPSRWQTTGQTKELQGWVIKKQVMVGLDFILGVVLLDSYAMMVILLN